MYIYNVTINIDPAVHDEWLKYMQDEHIPDVMKTGFFTESRILKVLNVEDAGTTYSIQYTFKEMKDMEEYKEKHAPRLQKEVMDRYKDKFVAFRTLLEIVP
jgi:hypothetical protein